MAVSDGWWRWGVNMPGARLSTVVSPHTRRRWRWSGASRLRVALLAVLAVAILTACTAAHEAPGQGTAVTPLAVAPGQALITLPQHAWASYVLPGKQATAYRFTAKEGRAAVEARSNRSASMLRQRMALEAQEWPTLSWSWWVEDVLADADLGDVDKTDSPASIVLAFDGDKSRLPARARMMFDLAKALTGEEPPYATLVYAWATSTPLESVVHNPRSDRIRKIVIESGNTHTRQWRDHRRNIVEDYRRAFGEDPGPLLGVALMTDTDNTRSAVRAWYGPVRLERSALQYPAGPRESANVAVSNSRSPANR